MLFKKKQQPQAAQSPIVGYTKSKRFLFFKIRSKPIYANAQKPKQGITGMTGTSGIGMAKPVKQARQFSVFHKKVSSITQSMQQPATGAAARAAAAAAQKPPSSLQKYIAKTVLKHKELDAALKEIGAKESTYEFVKRMLINTIIVTVVITVAIAAMLLHFGLGITGIILSAVLGYAVYMSLFQRFLQFPMQKSKQQGKGVERDILFAARDLVVSLRSGMPLFNAITAVSTGYGDASKEFAKIVELVQLGMPIEQAIDTASNESQSKTFKRIMLQASVSIKAGADVAGALQGVVEDVTQERVIELRRYGQRLNALAMFYMLFGVIFPSMGIAVAAILTTFINIFSVTPTLLLFALVGIFFLQIIFLNVMRSSRPVFTM
ncbi:MAG: type II secretion system F family protein [Candidatus Micrarchaeia archaeon]